MVSISGTSGGPCVAAAAQALYRFGYIGVAPFGRFAAAVRAGSFRVTVRGRFLTPGRATGTVSAAGTAPGPGGPCRLRGRFTARTLR